jgi:hypothetical protein
MTKGCHDTNPALARFSIAMGCLNRWCVSRRCIAAAGSVSAARQRPAGHHLHDAQLLVLGHTAGAAWRTVRLPDAQRLGSGLAAVGKSQPDHPGISGDAQFELGHLAA